MENEMRDLIISTLEGLVECKPNKALTIPCFMLDYGYIETGSVYGDGKCEISDQYVQIDLYYLSETAFKIAKKSLKNALINKKIFQDIDSYYDTTNKFYRATFKCVAQESEE